MPIVIAKGRLMEGTSNHQKKLFRDASEAARLGAMAAIVKHGGDRKRTIAIPIDGELSSSLNRHV